MARDTDDVASDVQVHGWFPDAASSAVVPVEDAGMSDPDPAEGGEVPSGYGWFPDEVAVVHDAGDAVAACGVTPAEPVAQGWFPAACVDDDGGPGIVDMVVDVRLASASARATPDDDVEDGTSGTVGADHVAVTVTIPMAASGVAMVATATFAPSRPAFPIALLAPPADSIPEGPVVPFPDFDLGLAVAEAAAANVVRRGTALVPVSATPTSMSGLATRGMSCEVVVADATDLAGWDDDFLHTEAFFESPVRLFRPSHVPVASSLAYKVDAWLRRRGGD